MEAVGLHLEGFAWKGRVFRGRDGRVAYGGALLRRWWQHRVGSNPTPSVERRAVRFLEFEPT